MARNSIRQVGEEEQHSHSAGQQGGGVVGQLLQAGPSPAAAFRRLPDVHQHVDGHDRQEQRGGEVDEPGCLQRFLCRGSNPEGSQFRVPRMSGMKAPAIMQAMPSSRLLMLTIISFPPGLRRMRLRQFCGFSSSGGPGWALAPPDALGMELEGHWCLKVANLEVWPETSIPPRPAFS